MNSRERVLAAVNHQTPDRIPLTIDMQGEVQTALLEHFGLDNRAQLWDKLQIDTWLVGASVADPDPDAEYPEDEDKNVWGYRTKQVSYGKGSYSEQVHFPLAGEFTKERIDAHPKPDPAAVTFDAIKEARINHPDRAIIAYITHGGYFNATFLRGLEQFLMDLYIEADNSEYLIKTVTEGFIFPALQRLIDEAGDSFDIFYMADDYCDATRPLFSPDIFRRMVKPYLSTIADMLHKADKKFLLHVCGAVRELLPDIIEAGVDMLEPIQTSATGMEVEGLKKDFGKDLTFYGSMDLVNVLNRATPDEVRAEVRKNIKVLGKDGGFILGPGHTYIQVDAPIENILAMYDEALKE